MPGDAAAQPSREDIGPAYTSMRASLLRLAVARGRARQDAEDVVQTAFGDLLEIVNGDPTSVRSTRAWLVRRVCTLCASVRRHDRCPVGPPREHPLSMEACEARPCRPPGPAEHAACGEQLARLRAALARLPARDRQILRWEYIEGRNPAEANAMIAREHGIGTRQAQRRRAAALGRLRRALAVLLPGAPVAEG
jgi:RNA polymerase sigma factor (sigma-70 family)